MNDWLFDYVLQFLESDRFDSAVMDFVDEKCEIFDNEEENKFTYSDIHREFRNHIEALLSSNLGELGVTSDFFFEACAKGRNSRDINRSVYDRMIAMDDFQTFKKIMVKRNMELQMEAMRIIKETGGIQLRAGAADDEEEQSRRVLRQSLLDMELVHKQEELEQLELEQALAMSLALEEERLRLKELEADFEDEEFYDAKGDERRWKQEEKLESKIEIDSFDSRRADHDHLHGQDSKVIHEAKRNPDDCKENSSHELSMRGAAAALTLKSDSSDSRAHAVSDSGSILRPLPPLKTSGFLNRPALPPIQSNRSAGSVAELHYQAEALEQKRKQADEALRNNQRLLDEQRRTEDDLRKQIDVGPDEVELRARYMREQRDRLLALKKQEREAKVAAEEARSKEMSEEEEEKMNSLKEFSASQVVAVSEAKEDVDIEKKRATMRMALARRMKQDLLVNEDDKTNMRVDQFSELDKKLKEVETLRIENQRREFTMQEQIRKQQAKIARNMKLSASMLPNDDVI